VRGEPRAAAGVEIGTLVGPIALDSIMLGVQNMITGGGTWAQINDCCEWAKQGFPLK